MRKLLVAPHAKSRSTTSASNTAVAPGASCALVRADDAQFGDKMAANAVAHASPDGHRPTAVNWPGYIDAKD